MIVFRFDWDDQGDSGAYRLVDGRPTCVEAQVWRVPASACRGDIDLDRGELLDYEIVDTISLSDARKSIVIPERGPDLRGDAAAQEVARLKAAMNGTVYAVNRKQEDEARREGRACVTSW